MPDSGGGKTIIDQCMTDECILQTDLLDEIPSEHRPDDEWIAARLRVKHEFRKRVAAGLQRKVKRKFWGGMGTGYTTSDEVWCHYKPTENQLRRWIEQEHKGETRIDEQSIVGESMQDNKGSTTAFNSSNTGSISNASLHGKKVRHGRIGLDPQTKVTNH